MIKKLVNIAQHALDYIKEEYHNRVYICDSCEYLADYGRCGECGCFISAKAAIPTAECPKGKW